MTLKGSTAGSYYVEVLPNYYLDSGEPKGRWHGRGAAALGLAGEVADVEFLRLMAGNDPRLLGEVPLGRIYGQGSVRGFDVTASAPKSVSVLFAVGDDATRAQVMAAHDAAVE
jgi:conjugative relaxase-like TrwC/TraI family protein